jgi:hypothetical protein
VLEIVWACFVTAGPLHSSSLQVQVAAEEELGSCCPTVFQGNIAILLNAVWVQPAQYPAPELHNSIIPGMYW